MEMPQGKYAWIVKIGEKGQFVIPKEARDMYDLQPGSSIIVLADVERGIAIPPKAIGAKYMAKIFDEITAEDQEG